MAVTPLPRLQMLILCIVIFAEPVSLTILYPFIYSMVRDFHLTDDDREISIYVGLIAASFSVAQFFTSLPWGYLSDKIGRRPVILIGLLGNLITSILFGLSGNFYMALLWRSLCGLLNGNIAVAKCMLGELTDASNQGVGFSMFGFSFGLGCVVAPTLGGLLANAADKYPESLGQIKFLADYPYFLPCFLSAVISAIGLVLGALYLKETMNKEVSVSVNDEESPLISRQRHLTRTSVIETDGPFLPALVVSEKECPGSSQSTHTQFVLPDGEEFDDCKTLRPLVHTPTFGTTTIRRTIPTMSRNQVLKQAFPAILGYSLTAFTQIIFQEAFVFWASTTPDLGGLSWGTDEIGVSMALGGLVLLLAQLFLFPPASRKWGNWNLYLWSCLAQVPMFFVTGFLQLAVYKGQSILWTVILIHTFIRVVLQSFAFTCINVAVNNAASRETLGLVNGVGQSAASFVRALGPFMGGLIWSWSAKNNELGFPLNFHFTFVLLAVISLLAWGQAFKVPKLQNGPANR